MPNLHVIKGDLHIVNNCMFIKCKQH